MTPVKETDKDKFMWDIFKVMMKHNISISHEDCGGSFILRQFNRSDAAWFMEATIGENLE